MAIFDEKVKKTGCHWRRYVAARYQLSMKSSVRAGGALLFLVIAFGAGSALAKPHPAGKCTVQDDGVAETAPAAPRPAIIVLPDVPPPNTGDPDKPFIADLVLDVRGDGAVARARVACTNVRDERYTSALLLKAKDWRIGRGKPRRYAYRVVLSPSGPRITPAPLP